MGSFSTESEEECLIKTFLIQGPTVRGHPIRPTPTEDIPTKTTRLMEVTTGPSLMGLPSRLTGQVAIRSITTTTRMEVITGNIAMEAPPTVNNVAPLWLTPSIG